MRMRELRGGEEEREEWGGEKVKMMRTT